MATPKDHFPCAACGTVHHIDELDAKPEPGADPETSDYTRLECKGCYGPGYVSAKPADEIATEAMEG